jgi:hypothetical protein
VRRRILLALAAGLLLAAPLAACAKKSAPLPPAGVADTYPRVYPPGAPGTYPSSAPGTYLPGAPDTYPPGVPGTYFPGAPGTYPPGAPSQDDSSE